MFRFLEGQSHTLPCFLADGEVAGYTLPCPMEGAVTCVCETGSPSGKEPWNTGCGRCARILQGLGKHFACDWRTHSPCCRERPPPVTALSLHNSIWTGDGKTGEGFALNGSAQNCLVFLTLTDYIP